MYYYGFSKLVKNQKEFSKGGGIFSDICRYLVSSDCTLLRPEPE